MPRLSAVRNAISTAVVSPNSPSTAVAETGVPGLRIPTDEEYRAFRGSHCPQLWAARDDRWRCEGCGRTKRELMEYKAGKTYDGVPTPAGWRIALHTHHDHRIDLGLPRRFPDTVMCGPCNSADGRAKRHLKLPNWFSYSPREIAYFVRGQAHGLHQLDFHKALEIWRYEGPALIAEAEGA